MTIKRGMGAMLAGGLLASACASAPPLQRQECYNPDAQLKAVLEPLEALRARGCDGGVGKSGTSDCSRLEREVQRLVVVCPGHAPTLMANAVIAYDQHQPVRAQQLLDELMSMSNSHPDAAVLRARIAIEEGNLPFAHRLLDEQIRLSPDHAGLHETLGGAHYLGGHLAEARRELATASQLGAPKWRVAYHLGLVEEASGRMDEARRRYAEALEGNPAYTQAESRLRALTLRNGPGQ